MAIRREVQRPQPTGEAPRWVEHMRTGLARFGGDLATWNRARLDWCRDNGCWRLPCGQPCDPPCGEWQPRSGMLHVVPVMVVSDGEA